MAIRDFGMAPKRGGVRQRPVEVLPRVCAGDRIRHPVFLGGPDGDDGHRVDRKDALPHNILARIS